MDKGTTNLAIAHRFARALDACDYSLAGRFLANDCRYIRPGEKTLIGADPILDTYRASDEKARCEFDFVRYRSEAAECESAKILLTFFDELGRGKQSHTFRCTQIVYFDDTHKIERIDLVEFPNERERLRKFCEKHPIPVGRG